MSAEPVSLRAHHLLCLRFYRGKGYDGAFCRNVSDVLEALTADAPVRLTSGPDDLCACCPHREEGCPNAGEYDRRVLALCGLETGEVLPWGRLQRTAAARILVPGRLAEVCGGCQWMDLCSKL